MLSKLALRNVKRSSRDYIIYLITITIAFSLMFAMNLVSWSDAVVDISRNIDNTFKNVVIFINVIVVFVICFLINYTTKFMFEKRSKEFGTYMLLGIKKKKISKLFLLENMLFGVVSLILSIPIGFVFSQFISLFIVKVMELPQAIFIEFNFMSVILLLIYFFVIYFIILFLANRRIKKINIYNLLYLEKQNEEKVIKTKKHRNLIFIISLLVGIGSFIFLNSKLTVDVMMSTTLLTYIMIGIVLFIISIYGVMFSLSDFMLSIVLKNKKIKYSKDNLFVARTFSSKARTMGMTFGILGVLIMFILLFLNFSSLNKASYDYINESTSPFDVSALFETEKPLSKIYDVVDKNYKIVDSIKYKVYLNKNSNIEKLLPAYSYTSEPYDKIIRVSDYNHLLKMKGKKEVTLNKDEYILVYDTSSSFLATENSIKTITLSNGITLNQKSITSELSFAGLTNADYAVVVPDDAVNGLDIYQYFMSIDTKEDTTSELEAKLIEKLGSDLCEVDEEGRTVCSTYRINVRGTTLEESNISSAIVTAISIYMSFIFSAIVGTILAIQTLSDSAKYNYRYTVLKRLGVNDEKIYKTIRKQLYVLFGMPALYPIIISFAIVYLLNRVYKSILPSPTFYLSCFGISIAIFIMIYVIYFVGTYFSFKRNIQKS